MIVTATLQSHSEAKKEKPMAKAHKLPLYVRAGNILTLTLLRAGFKLVGPGLVVGNYPMITTQTK